jgi:ribbon-helix-helix CopG family protein
MQAKFMQSLNQNVYEQLERMAKERGISVQELVRAVVVPEWMQIRNANGEGVVQRLNGRLT